MTKVVRTMFLAALIVAGVQLLVSIAEFAWWVLRSIPKEWES
jgi:hypothetical protein